MGMVFMVLLGVCVIHDLRRKEIPTILIWILIGSMFVYRVYLLILGKCSIKESVICILPGMLLLLISYVGKQIGKGDGFLIIAEGLYMGWMELMSVIYYSFLTAGLFCMGYFLLCHREKNEKIPFVPFLFWGTVVVFGEGLQ